MTVDNALAIEARVMHNVSVPVHLKALNLGDMGGKQDAASPDTCIVRTHSGSYASIAQ